MTISENELRKGFEDIGFHTSDDIFSALFDELDESSNYKISFHEMKRWLEADD